MADERDPGVSAAYRALGAEEPPHALDEAILAAARRPSKTWTQRWALPLSLAAVVLLSVTVTLQMQLEQPGIDGLQAPRPAQEARVQEPPQTLKLKAEEQLKLAAKPQARQETRRAEPKAFADASADRAPRAAAGSSVAQAPAAPPPAAASGNLASRGDSGSGAESRYGDSALRREEDRVARDAEAAARAPQAAAALAKRNAPEPAVAPKPAPPARAISESAPKPAAEQPAKMAGPPAGKVAAETPEQEFERIAQLRREGRNDEADRAFLEFRRRYPDFRITEEMLRRVERR